MLVWELIGQGLNTATIAEKTGMHRKTLWGHLDTLQKSGCIAKNERVGRAWTYRQLRQPSIVSPRPGTLVKNVSTSFYLPHNVTGYFDVLTGTVEREGNDAVKWWLEPANAPMDKQTVHGEFVVDFCRIDYWVGPKGKQGFSVNVPEPLITGPSIEEAQLQAMRLMRGAAVKFCADKRLELGEGAPWRTTFYEWVNQVKALSRQAVKEANLERQSVLVDTPEGPDLVLTSKSHFGDEQHTGPAASFGAKQGRLLWSGRIVSAINELGALQVKQAEAVRALAETAGARGEVTEAKLQVLETSVQRLAELLEVAVERVGGRRR